MNLKEFLNKSNIILSEGTIGNSFFDSNIFLIYKEFTSSNNIFIVTKTIEEAHLYYDELLKYISKDSLYLFLEENTYSSKYTNAIEFLTDRIRLFVDIVSKKNVKVVVCNYLSFYFKRVPINVFEDSTIDISLDNPIYEDKLINLLINLGYKKNYLLSSSLEYSKRGDIVDIFPLFSNYPIRLTYDYDELNSISYFDLNTNLKKESISSFLLTPATDLIYSDDVLDDCLIKLETILDEEDFSSLSTSFKERDRNTVLNKYISFLYEDAKAIFNYIDAKVFFVSKEESDFLLELENKDNSTLNYLDTFNKSYYNLVPFSSSFNLDSLDVSNFYGNIDNLLFHLKANVISKKYTLVSCYNSVFYNTLSNLVIDNNLSSDYLYLTLDNIPSFNSSSFEVISYFNIFNNEIKKKNKHNTSYIKHSTKINSVDELKEGDYIIHIDYGIGRYLGIVTKTLNGITRDYLFIEYKGDNRLYIPIDKLNKISKYSDGFINIELDDLDPNKWKKLKEKAKKKIKSISDELLRLYSLRKQTKGFSFLEDDEDSLEFLNDFPHTHTADQLKAIDDIKKDMEATYPMERLLIGDVGYGKTEVCMNACFKALKSLKQVCILAPTTILVNQHFRTFSERFKKYNFNIRFLNRFTKNVKKELQDLKNGVTDIIIGTHRLLSNDVFFYDLGLLVIDEEQRFGVRHKERIKEIAINVDTLSMSATPIPRTLEMSLSGIKDLSVINTPPLNRYFVETHVLKRSDSVIRDAIFRELNRNGQIFYLYNHIDTILEIKKYLLKLVPTLKIGIVHGKLSSLELEDRINDFINGYTNLLLCTTIIETGIDIPNANTLIIHDANSLGLAQLYQLRGRVGRSNRHAYSYMLYSPNAVLDEDAYKRLKAIEEYQELGSGYKIAYMDLTIRGGGNILGSEQSGFIDDLGVDLYLKLLDEEINHNKLNDDTFKFLNFSLSSSFISRDYIEDSSLRIYYHKQILNVYSSLDKEKLVNELTDIFGNIPLELELYINEVLMKHLLEEFGFVDFKKDLNTYIFIMSSDISSKINGVLFFEKLIDGINIEFNDNIIRLLCRFNDLYTMFISVIKYLESLKGDMWLCQD